MAKSNVWKPTQDQCNIIKAAAYAECGKRVSLEPGRRYSTIDADIPASINGLLVDKSEDWEDSDLQDHDSWGSFRKGLELTPDGKAAVDFYCYDRDGLVSNLIAYYDNGALECYGTLRGMVSARKKAQK